MQSCLAYGVREFTQLTQQPQQKPSLGTLQSKSRHDTRSGRSTMNQQVRKSSAFNDHDWERRLPSVEAESALEEDL